MRCRNDVDLAIRTEFFNDSIDQRRIEERLIPLNINDEIKPLRFSGDLGDPVSSALVKRRGHRHLRTPIKSRPSDPHVVCGDNECIKFFCPLAKIPYLPKKR